MIIIVVNKKTITIIITIIIIIIIIIMDFLLDDRKVFWICGVILSICIFIYLLPAKKEPIINLKQIPATGIIGYEPKYFNKEILQIL
jgi:hypothetical protein